MQLGLHLDPQKLEILMYLIELYYSIFDFEKCIEISRELYDLAADGRSIDKALSHQCLIRALLSHCIYWEEAVKIYLESEAYLRTLVEEKPIDLSRRDAVFHLMTTGFYSPYFSDRPQESHQLRGLVRQLAYERLYAIEKENIDNYRKRLAIRKKIYSPNRPLKIGYLSNSLRSHSVGYLSRWLIQYQNRDRFELYGYMCDYRSADPLQQWFANQFHKVYKDKVYDPVELANQIIQDGIDILLDLDSMTSEMGSGVLALKPAPIQVTWLGWDAVGQPNVDYFIADPYVLPETAEEYYTEKIWRLPHTYLAVDGFEVATPTIRRDLLNIPHDAVIYFSSQAAMKRHPDTIRLQMRIIKLVPNSYLLLKGFGNQSSLQNFFYQLAELEDISTDRLVFLPYANGETEHRANLSIADVVLDTYPYNGATHTMESLWMGIPMVTRVGEQFVARNSYTMMLNAGITEGIAWTDEEYVEWGVKLGTDVNLRQQVAWKLQQGRQTSPLWNSRQFTKEMENAYEQMWKIYLESDTQDIELDPLADCQLFIAEAELQNTQGIQFAQQGMLDEAISSFQNAISLYSDYADAYYNLGIALSEKGDFKNALVNFQTTVTLNPNNVNSLYNLGLTFAKLGYFDEAISSYSHAIALAPNEVETHLAWGNVLFEQGKWQEAITCYQAALQYNPNCETAHYGIESALSKQSSLNKNT
jgi:predicted O-linked N-acetylglucosamine transferase (SPINDLY family)